MKFISLCSGIEAASVAFNPLGWEAICFAEIEPFPSALLQERFPHVPNMGDMSRYDEWPEEFFADADMIVGGPPCQSFSVAGKRGGLDDDRGNLTLTFTELINHADAIRRKHGKPPVIILYENVPGLLSDKTNAFGCLLGALAGEDDQLNPSGQRWTNAGAVLGPERSIAWRILDAQYFGLAQRRKRVFVVASAREGFCPAQVLFEYDGVRRDIAPSRESGKETAGNVGAGFTPSSFGGYREGVGTLRAAGGDLGGGSETLSVGKWPADIASTLNASFGDKLGLENQHIDGGAPLFVPAKAFGIPGNWNGRKPENGGNSTQFMHEVPPAQTATDKHGVVAFAQNTRDEVRYIGGDGQITGALAASPGMKQTTYLAFNSRQDPVSSDVFGALDTCSPQAQAIAHGCTPTRLNDTVNTITASYGQGGVDLETKPLALVTAIADDVTPKTSEEIGFTLSATDFKCPQAVQSIEMMVRRLTPIECERLQGFKDGYTAIPWRNKPASECPDGHRYKALGNSWAVPVVHWIGKRIANFLDDTEITW